jgi:glycine cleavage system P protein (glycine dehydrogenase) subunit 1
MRYLPHTPADVARMLDAIGVRSVEDLFSSIPARIRLGRPLDLPCALDEAALLSHLQELAGRNRTTPAFLGGGVHHHPAPAAADMLLLRAEFYTAYTPYQPEISQGTLQAIFEFQTIVAELFGLDVANASMYDGASACAEAVLMARRLTGRHGVVLLGSVHPEYREVCEAYLRGVEEGDPGSGVRWLPTGACDLGALDRAVGAGTACVVVQSPNFFGVLEDLDAVARIAHARGALAIAVVCEPAALALARAPGEAGFDVAIGEGIGFCGHTSLGGPGVGLFAARAEHVRALPGRLVGETVDGAGRRGYVLTLATREQHIRRERATSNICTNQGLMALAFTIHMCLLGRHGVAQMARLNLARAEYARRTLARLPGFSLRFDGPTFNEFALRVPGGHAGRCVEALGERGLVPGVPLSRFPSLGADLHDTLLVGVTEMHKKADIDRLAAALLEFRA